MVNNAGFHGWHSTREGPLLTTPIPSRHTGARRDELLACLPGAKFVGDGHPATASSTRRGWSRYSRQRPISLITRRRPSHHAGRTISTLACPEVDGRRPGVVLHLRNRCPNDLALDPAGNLISPIVERTRVASTRQACATSYASGGDPDDGFGDDLNADDDHRPNAIVFDQKPNSTLPTTTLLRLFPAWWCAGRHHRVITTVGRYYRDTADGGGYDAQLGRRASRSRRKPLRPQQWCAAACGSRRPGSAASRN